MLAVEHEVQVVTSAREAMDLVSGGERFDVVLCDLMMPEMTGMDINDELLRGAPEQAEKLVFMTGGAFTSRAREFLDHVRHQTIDKPFDRNKLRAIIHRVLSEEWRRSRVYGPR